MLSITGVQPQYSLLGLIKRAGYLVVGHDAVLRLLSLSRSKVHLLLIAANLSSKNRERWKTVCEEQKVPLGIVGDKLALGKAVGGPPLSVMAITDAGFAQALRKNLGCSEEDLFFVESSSSDSQALG